MLAASTKPIASEAVLSASAKKAAPIAELHWDLTNIHPDVTAPSFTAALIRVHAEVRELVGRAAIVAETESGELPAAICTFDRAWCECRDTIQELYVFCDALRICGDDRRVVARARKSTISLAVLNQRAPRPILTRLSEETAQLRDTVLNHLPSVAGRNRFAGWIVEALAPPQFDGTTEDDGQFQRAYTTLLDDLTIEVVNAEGQLVGTLPARLANRTLWSAEPENRQTLAHAIQAAWAPHQELVSAVLHRKARPSLGAHAFADALREDGLSPQTAHAVMEVLGEGRETGQGGLAVQAGLAGKKSLALWDIAAFHPPAGRIALDKAIEDVSRAFETIDPDMRAFFETAVTRGWIDARPSAPGRVTTDLQTAISRRGQPLVFINYDDLPRNAIRLAHECAHAYHFHAVRAMPAERHAIASPLAETVSAIAEQALRDVWAKDGKQDVVAAHRFAWTEAESLATNLIQLPMNAALELSLARAQTAPAPRELQKIAHDLARFWQGGAIRPWDDLAWSCAPILSTARRFHGMPYVIGFLTAQPLLSARDTDANSFPKRFQTLLSDMATASTEDVLGDVLSGPAHAPEQWRAALAHAQHRLERLKAYIAGRGLAG
ncbi:hypothetical protein B5P46_01610 [Rhizobium leguminosarum]|uniref:Peptidase M3A/M3B catalytic domain-containing protein n=1 Tax=Rhizobium leguminosarum TaxID=384 RepID=A0A4Q1UCV1_RHILE|nr:hypothetical protein [Rhizobium leguminosarum]RXT29796.1 hypothetical protein B5P46_01610 [Rhizobium leguminosarum]